MVAYTYAMRNKRLLLALGVVLAVLGICASAVLWRASRALRTSASEIDREGRVRFTSATLELQAPAGFETLSAPAAFRDAAIFGDHLFVAGDAGLFEYDAGGVLLNSFRTGMELPAAPVVAAAAGIGGGSAAPELWLATVGEGALAYDGTRFRHIRPDSASARKLTSVLPLSTGRILFGGESSGVLAFDGKELAPLHPSLGGLHVTALAGDEANLWIGTRDNGVLHWHGGQLDHFGEPEGMPDAHVFSVAID